MIFFGKFSCWDPNYIFGKLILLRSRTMYFGKYFHQKSNEIFWKLTKIYVINNMAFMKWKFHTNIPYVYILKNDTNETSNDLEHWYINIIYSKNNLFKCHKNVILKKSQLKVFDINKIQTYHFETQVFSGQIFIRHKIINFKNHTILFKYSSILLCPCEIAAIIA